MASTTSSEATEPSIIYFYPHVQCPLQNKSGIIHCYRCDRVDWDEEYFGESARTFEAKYREHLKIPSCIHGHQNNTGHQMPMDNFSIVSREEHGFTRTIKESIYIRVNNPP